MLSLQFLGVLALQFMFAAGCSNSSDYCATVAVSNGKGITSISLQEAPSSTNSIQYFDIEFVISGGACDVPAITMVYEEIDFSSTSSEYLELTYNGGVVNRCTTGRDAQCGNFVTCLDYSSFGPTTVADGSSVIFTLEVGPEIDSLCSQFHTFGVVADFTLTCDMTRSPTNSPTTAAPSLTPTKNPTITGYCPGYCEPLVVSNGVGFTTIPVKELPSSGNVVETYEVQFDIEGETCDNPSVNMIYEEIDFSSTSSEYLELFYLGNRLNRCTTGRDAVCGNFETCLRFDNIGVPSLSNGTRVTFTLKVGEQVDALCGGSHPYGVVTNITLYCGMTASPTYAPTLAPPDYIVSLTPDTNIQVSATAEVEELPSPFNEVEVIKMHFQVDPNGPACFNPRVSMVYEGIDFSSNDTEYLKLKSQGNIIKRCSSGRDGQCGLYFPCVTDASFGVNVIAPGSEAILALEVGEQIDALCSRNHPYGVRSNITVSCDPATSVLGECEGGNRKHAISVPSGTIVDPLECGMGCSTVASILECNNLCYQTSGCKAYLFSPALANNCALFDSKGPISRSGYEVYCSPCAGGVRAEEVAPMVDDLSFVDNVKNNLDNTDWTTFIAVNAAVSMVVSLCVVFSAVGVYYACNSCNRKQYVVLDQDNDKLEA